MEACCLVLPFERADCLFNMRYPGDEEYFGMHWVSKLVVHQLHPFDADLQSINMRSNNGVQPMNRRFVEMCHYFFQHTILPDGHIDPIDRDRLLLIKCLIAPVKSPRETDEVLDAVTIENVPQDLLRRQAPELIPLREEVRGYIVQATDIHHFRFIYRSEVFSNFVRVLRNMQSDQATDFFANRWAANPLEYDIVFAADDLFMMLEVYNRLYECLVDATNTSVTVASIHQEFRVQQIMNVLHIALPMARAYAQRHQYPWPPLWLHHFCDTLGMAHEFGAYLAP